MKRLSLMSTLGLFAVLLISACRPVASITRDGDVILDGVSANGTGTESNEAPPVTVANDNESEASLAANEDAPSITQQGPANSVDETTVETDAFGIEVGFTDEGRPYRGNADAAIVLREFSDFQCPFCARFTQETMPGLLENQIAAGDVMLVFYDYPLTSIHPQAVAAANAARCAGEQGAAAYWAMHDALFENIGEWSNNGAETVFNQYAAEQALDETAFAQCQEEDRYHDVIMSDVDFGVAQGVRSTPTFFVNDQMLVGAQPLPAFNQAITAVQNGEEIAAAAPPPPPNPAVAPTPATIVTSDVAASMGDPAAAVTIIEYTDYQCPYCSRHSLQTLPLILSELIESGRVHYMLKDFPLDNIHPEARAGAVAARCAGEQDAYWEMHDALFVAQQNWSGLGIEAAQASYANLAADLALDVDAFNVCQSSGKYDAEIEANLQEGASLGVRGTPAFFIDGFPVSGAQPFELFDYAVGLAEEGELAQAYVQSEPTPVPTPSGPIEIATADSYAVGDPDAPITIVEYTDFQCPFCARHQLQTYPQIKANYIDTGIVYYVFKDFPLTSIHPQAVTAAVAARCAGDQGAYLEMHGLLFARQSAWSGRGDAVQVFTGYAEELGLEATLFSSCMVENKYEAAVFADLEEGSQSGIQGTPGFFINGFFLNGAQPYETFVEAIDHFLTQ